MNTNRARPSSPSKGKRRTVIILAAVSVVIAILGYLLVFQPTIILKKKSPLTMYSSTTVAPEKFRLPDPEYDIMADEEYLGLDRAVYYTLGAETFAVDADTAGEYGRTVVFFLDYFDAILAGQSERYNSFFTDKYYKSVRPYGDFTPQMLYDINVKQLSVKNEDGGAVRYTYEVGYRIFKNDGTFRRDIESDANRRLYFELIETRDSVMIDFTSAFLTK